MSTKDERERIELPQGTLDLLILRTLLLGPRHGHALAKTIKFNSDDVLQAEQGSLYSALDAYHTGSKSGLQARFVEAAAAIDKAVGTDQWVKCDEGRCGNYTAGRGFGCLSDHGDR